MVIVIARIMSQADSVTGTTLGILSTVIYPHLPSTSSQTVPRISPYFLYSAASKTDN